MSVPTSWGYYGIDWTSPATLSTAPLPLVLKTLAFAYDERFGTSYGAFVDGSAIRLSTLIPQPEPVPGNANTAFMPPDLFDSENNFIGSLSTDANHVYFTQTKLLELLGVDARIPRPTSTQAISAAWLHETYRVLNLLRYRRVSATQEQKSKTVVASYESYGGSLSATRDAVIAALIAGAWTDTVSVTLAPQQVIQFTDTAITAQVVKRLFSSINVPLPATVPGALLYYRQTESVRLVNPPPTEYTNIFEGGGFSPDGEPLSVSRITRWLNIVVGGKDELASTYEIYAGDDFDLGSAQASIPSTDHVVEYGWGTADRSNSTQKHVLVFDANFNMRTW